MFYPMYRYGGNQAGYLLSFIGKSVKINRGGPESIEGRLIAVHADYIVLLTKGSVVYVNAAHIKSITEGKSSQTAGRTGSRVAYIMAQSFNDVLRRLTKQFVQINQGGPEKVTGFVVEVGPDNLLLVSGKEVIRIPLFHIRTVSPAQRNGSRSGSDDQSRDDRQRSRGQRSGGRNDGSGSRSQGGRQGSQGRLWYGGGQKAGVTRGSRQEGGSRGRMGGQDRHHGSRGHSRQPGRRRYRRSPEVTPGPPLCRVADSASNRAGPPAGPIRGEST